MENPLPEHWMPKGDCDSVGSQCWSRLLTGPVYPWREESMLKVDPGRTCDPIGEPMLKQSAPEGADYTRAVCGELQPLGRTHSEEVCGGFFPVGRTPLWSRGSVSNEEEGIADTACDELTTASITT
ncbi:hypothetical protein HGM15179_005388 [Zosterops borbonicus]|uniref:Uncharacterized protein n=1 Tax=Zosterops borbonicus TaxID=364589 RepID=A0A8K1GMA2_9PASS|nr:hypothetical protein HGM15179_005388 [Zosterops borbonicus]